VGDYTARNKKYSKMVLKNVKYGEVENVTVIELGNGVVDVADTTHNSGVVGVMFTNNPNGKLGESKDLNGKSSDDVGIDAIITFETIESIEVLERAIERSKNELKRTLAKKEALV